MKTALTLALVSCLGVASGVAKADYVMRQMPACISEDLLDEMTSYVVSGDEKGFTQLILSGKCTILERGSEVSVISRGFMTSTLRYRGVKLFTAAEALR